MIKEYKDGHGYSVCSIAVNIESKVIASAGGDRAIVFWDLNTARVIRKLRGHESKINSLQYNQNFSAIFSGSYDKTVRVWDLKARSRKPIQIMSQFKDSVSCVMVRDNSIFTGCIDGCIRIFDIRMGMLTTDHLGYPVTDITVSSDNKCILASCLDSTVRLMDLSDGSMLQSYKGHVNKDTAISSGLTHNDAYVFSASEDGNLLFWELVDAKQAAKIKAHDTTVTCAIYHNTSNKMLTADIRGYIKLWN